jgi:nickel-dependent lactate racemase
MRVSVPDGARVVLPPTAPAGAPLAALLDEALAAPIGAPPLAPCARVTIVVSDATRAEPRAALVQAVLRRVGDAAVTLAIANGTHAPGDVAALELPTDVLARATIVNHDARDAAAMVELGVTARGTPLRVHRCLAEAALVVATGKIKPHYFAGFGAGAKAIFPGLGEETSIRINHRLKQAPGARAGVVDGNPCREDIEESVALLPTPSFLLDCVLDADGNPVGAVAGDVRAAFRAGAEMARPLYQVRAPRSRAVVVSDRLPLTASLYQASKLAAAAADLLEPDGTMVIAAECGDGVGGIDVVNRAIYDIGIKPRLPERHRIVLVSSLPRETVAQTYCAWAPTVEAALAGVDAAPTVLPRAGDALVEVVP